jgi:hypothetical protein
LEWVAMDDFSRIQAGCFVPAESSWAWWRSSSFSLIGLRILPFGRPFWDMQVDM